MHLCPRVPPPLPAASPRAVGQLSASLPCSLGVHDVCHVWGEVALETPGPEEPELSLPGTFIVSASGLLRVRGWVGVGERVELVCVCVLSCRV